MAEHQEETTFLPGTTAQFPLHRTEKLKTCKYDKSHKILLDRYILHLRKCRAAYLKKQSEEGLPSEIDVCIYDYSHHIPKAKMSQHVAAIGGKCKTALKDGLIQPGPGEPMPTFDDVNGTFSDSD